MATSDLSKAEWWKQAVDEFVEIYLKEFRIKLDRAEAEEKATRLLELFRVIYKPIPKSEVDEA